MNVLGHTREEVFMVLYNRAMPLGNGFLHYVPKQIDLAEAKEFLKTYPGNYFDYVKGRVMKVDLSRPEVNTVLYNHDNGKNAAEDAWMDYLTAQKKP